MTKARSNSTFGRVSLVFLAVLLGGASCSGGGGGGRTPPGSGSDPTEDADAGAGGTKPTNPPSGGSRKDAAPSSVDPQSPDAREPSSTTPDADNGSTTGPTDGPPVVSQPVPDELPPCKRTVPVANTGALASAVGSAQAGDCIVLADGAYELPAITGKQGTATNPIVVKAANLLKATVDAGPFTISDSAYVVVQGIMYRSGTPAKVNNCDHCRVTRNRFQLKDGGFDTLSVSGTSKNVRVDHNDFGPKTVLGNTLMLGGSGSQIVQFTRIDHNYFHDVSGGGGNGWETIRAGLSGWSFSSSKTVIEYNLFQRCTGDPETISIKSSDNTLRFNTLRGNRGEMTLRHGNRQIVYGNYILDGPSGIRVCGGQHKIFSNYIGNVTGKAIFLEGGEHDDTSGMLTDHKQVYDTSVLFNTVVSSQGIQVGGSHPMNPKNCVVANNLLQGGSMLTEVAGSENIVYSNNFVNGGASVNTAGAVKMIDPMLMKVGEIYRIAAGSPAIDAADAKYTVTEDIDATMRTGKLDVGADELVASGQLQAPLTEKDVGPLSP
jgi:poly(beta-D-mannuronate) lyase